MAEPLYSLLRKGNKWEWDERCQQAFDELRSRLIREPVVLAHPNWEHDFYVEADASATGVAAVLSQLDEATGKFRPIQFVSSALTPAQRNCCAGQLEAWGAFT